MNSNQLKQLRKALTNLGRKDSKPVDPTCGICPNVIRLCGLPLGSYYPFYYETIKRWKYFSGVCLFPIPNPTQFKELYPGLYYMNFKDKWTGQQGDMRRKFCRYLVRELNKYCKKNGIKL